jgi:hypothetical protein
MYSNHQKQNDRVKSTTRDNSSKFSLAGALCYRRSSSNAAKQSKCFGSKDEDIHHSNLRRHKKTKLPTIASPKTVFNSINAKKSKISPASKEKILIPINQKTRFGRSSSPKLHKVVVDCKTTKIVTPVTTPLNPLTGIIEIRECIPKSECLNIISKVEDYALRNGWTYDRHKFFPTVDIPTKNVSAIRPICQTILENIVYPQVRKQFCLHDATFTVADEFIVKYAVDGDDRSRDKLDAHRDGSLISYNILLNDASEFAGGGTYFECINHTVTPEQGTMVLHCGKLRHSGRKITRGTRYILIGFLDVHSTALEDVRKDQKRDLQTDKVWLDTLWKPLRQFFIGDIVRCRGYHVQHGSVKGLPFTYEGRIVKIRYGTNYVTIEQYPSYDLKYPRKSHTKIITADNILSIKSSKVKGQLCSWK